MNTTKGIKRMCYLAGAVYTLLAVYQMFIFRFVLNNNLPITGIPVGMLVEMGLILLAGGLAAWMFARAKALPERVRFSVLVLTIMVVAFNLVTYQLQDMIVDNFFLVTFPNLTAPTFLRFACVFLKLALWIVGAFFALSAKPAQAQLDSEAQQPLPHPAPVEAEVIAAAVMAEAAEAAIEERVAEEILAEAIEAAAEEEADAAAEEEINAVLQNTAQQTQEELLNDVVEEELAELEEKEQAASAQAEEEAAGAEGGEESAAAQAEDGPAAGEAEETLQPQEDAAQPEDAQEAAGSRAKSSRRRRKKKR